ncbi:GSCFA domain-containing protein [Chitinophagaceae bacterium 26-R-25]|nr:GSCFA domain-containing protein [Chitinophagaceae bacterium 26-R-25]
MDFMLDINIKSPDVPVQYGENIMLMGSCFTEHIGNRLEELKFNTLQNPNGILFDPVSVCKSLVSYIENKQYTADDLFYLNELWQSWQHHSRFSGMDQQNVLAQINASQQRAHDFLMNADWLIVTLGSSFSYRLAENNESVANCHRAPAQTFRKHLLSIEETVTSLDTTMHRLFHFNKKLKIIFTISPVRHIRDGVVENNRSKARLLEAVHHMVNKFDRLHYFPAYELVIDVLRDYRFYDVDMVHPNYPATEFVFEKFVQHYFSDASKDLMKEIRQIAIARRHRSMQPATNAHQQFLKSHYDKAQKLSAQHPFLDLSEEMEYFQGNA